MAAIADSFAAMSVAEPLFTVAKSKSAILLIDKSGSTMTPFKLNKTVFDEMERIVTELGHDEYRIVFWNDPSLNIGRYVNGVMKLPFVVRQVGIHTAFVAAATESAGTCPYLGFQAIETAWLASDPMVYFITDGQIGGSIGTLENNRLFIESIKNLKAQLTIIAVETVVRDFNKVENVQNAAGGDIYALIQRAGLTGKVSKFVSYNPAGCFTQIDKIKAPAGFAPYGGKMFSVLRVPEFIQVVIADLAEAKDEGGQLEIAQKLSSTLEVLTRDKPKHLVNDIIRMFSGLFTIDANMVQYIMTEAIDRERGGQAQVFANYRASLKNLFAQADQNLKRDVAGSIGMENEFVSFITANRVLRGSYRLAGATVTINSVGYPQAGFNPVVPVYPVLGAGDVGQELTDQCRRQWIRCVYAALYSVHPTADEIIYLVLGNMLKVVKSDVSDKIKNTFKQTANCILRKKRLNSMQTEMDRLLAGELPIPNSGKFEDFIVYMNRVKTKLNIEGDPMKIWYEICNAISPILAAKQQKHCEQVLATEFKCETVHEDVIPTSQTYDYQCLVTLDDLSSVGGYAINTHVGPAGLCSPVYLFSQKGLDDMLASHNCVCPVCYYRLGADKFTAVGPKIPFELNPSYSAYTELFKRPVAAEQKISRADRVEQISHPKTQVTKGGIRNANGKTGKIVIMKGTVGSGKSTISSRIKAHVEARGGVCYVEGTDKYCKDGTHIKQAVVMVQFALRRVADEKNDDIVVVIDTCGEQTQPNQTRHFDVDFKGWTRIDVYANYNRAYTRGYLAWSLRNVLMRGVPGYNDNFNLNPVKATPSVCIEVHKKKSTGLGIGVLDWNFTFATVDSLKAEAEAYVDKIPPIEDVLRLV